MFLGLKQDFLHNHATPIDQLDCNWSVVRHHDQFYMLSNVCPHKHSRIAHCQTPELKCPYHGLAYTLQGQGILNNYSLQQKSCYLLGSMVFDLPVHYEFPIETKHFVLMEHRRDCVNAAVETIMSVFLDIEHIPVAHDGVYDKIGITNVENIIMKYFDGGSIQLVPAQDQTFKIEDDRKFDLGACWMALDPGTMIEWQPGALFVTVAHDKGVEVYKYRDTRYSDNQWHINEMTWELAWSQDKQLSENIVVTKLHAM